MARAGALSRPARARTTEAADRCGAALTRPPRVPREAARAAVVGRGVAIDRRTRAVRRAVDAHPIGAGLAGGTGQSKTDCALCAPDRDRITLKVARATSAGRARIAER